MSSKNLELFDVMSESTHAAAGLLVDMVAGETPVDWEQIFKVRTLLIKAVSAATSLESLLAGNPQPKVG